MQHFAGLIKFETIDKSAPIHLPAVASNLPTAASQGGDIPHVDHWLREVLKERALAASIAIHRGGSRRTASRQELLVRLEEAAVVLEVGVVVVVERVGRGWVEIVQDRPVPALRAVLLQCG